MGKEYAKSPRKLQGARKGRPLKSWKAVWSQVALYYSIEAPGHSHMGVPHPDVSWGLSHPILWLPRYGPLRVRQEILSSASPF